MQVTPSRATGCAPRAASRAPRQAGADRRVAAVAEVADRALGQIVDLLLELVEHRRDRRVGVAATTSTPRRSSRGTRRIALRWDRATRRLSRLPWPSGLALAALDFSAAFPAVALLSSSCLMSASSAASASVAVAAPLFSASFNPGRACLTGISAASLDAATAFRLRNAASISVALARAHESIKIPGHCFIALPSNFNSGWHPDLHRSRETAPAPFEISTQKLTLQKRLSYGRKEMERRNRTGKTPGCRFIERSAKCCLERLFWKAPHFCQIGRRYSSLRDQWDVHKAGRGN